MYHKFKHLQSAFTLIELLIVVAIIAILAAIAVPNFLEAQTRAKISRAKADMKTIVTALETYQIDNNKYVDAVTNSDLENHGNAASSMPAPVPAYAALVVLSTPVSYLSAIPLEAPFKTYQGFGVPPERGYQYSGGNTQWKQIRRMGYIPVWFPAGFKGVEYYLLAAGPTKIYSGKKNESSGNYPRVIPYQPTNGTVSTGDILYAAGSNGGHHSFD